MIPAAFDYVRPDTVDEALGYLAAPGARAIAGGQSLLPLLKMRLAHVDRLVDIGRIAELRGMRTLPDGSVELGALTTYSDLLARPRLSWTGQAIESIADVQTRNRGTVGGAIAHADPALDLPAFMLALDYSAVLRSHRGERVVPLDGFFLGPFHTAMEPDELLISLRRPPLPAGASGAYRTLEQPASGYSIVGIAAVVAQTGDTLGHVRVGVTGVADAAYRAKAVEAALVGTDGSPEAVAAAAEHVVDGRIVNGDIHADATYRAAMAKVYTRRALEAALGR